MRKKTLTLLISIIMVCCFIPNVAFATGDVAEKGNVKYSDLATAVSEAQTGDTIKLLNNTDENINILGKNITLDLNGFTLKDNGDHTITIKEGAQLTIIDSQRSGKVDNTTHGKAAIYNKGVAILNGGTYTRSAEGTGNSYYVILNYEGNMTINTASVINTSTYSTAVENKTDDDDKPARLTINKGATIKNNFTAVKNGYVSELTINGGVIEGLNSNKAVQTYGNTTIKGGTFNGDVEATDWTANDTYFPVLTIEDGIINGAVRANALKNDGQVGTDAKVIITGGTIKGQVYKSYQDGNIAPQEPNYEKCEIKISGGNFSNEIPDEFCEEGYKVLQNADGTYSVKNTSEQPDASAKADNNSPQTGDNSATLPWIILMVIVAVAGIGTACYRRKNIAK